VAELLGAEHGFLRAVDDFVSAVGLAQMAVVARSLPLLLFGSKVSAGCSVARADVMESVWNIVERLSLRSWLIAGKVGRVKHGLVREAVLRGQLSRQVLFKMRGLLPRSAPVSFSCLLRLWFLPVGKGLYHLIFNLEAFITSLSLSYV